MDALDPSALSAKFKADLDGVRSAFDALNNTRTGADRFSMTAHSRRQVIIPALSVIWSA